MTCLIRNTQGWSFTMCVFTKNLKLRLKSQHRVSQRGGVPTSKVGPPAFIWRIIFCKLQENEKNWTRRGASLSPPSPGSANVKGWCRYSLIVYCCLPPASERWGKYRFHRCLSVHREGGGSHLHLIILPLVPGPFLGGGGVPQPWQDGIPLLSRSGRRGYPGLPPPPHAEPGCGKDFGIHSSYTLFTDVLYCVRVRVVVWLLSQCWTWVWEGAKYSLIVHTVYNDVLYCFRVWVVVLLLSQCWTRVREGAEYSLIVYYYYMILCTVSGYGLSCYYCHSAEPGCGKELSIRWLCTLFTMMFCTVSGYGLSCYYCHSAEPGCGKELSIRWLYIIIIWYFVLFQGMGCRVITVTVLNPGAGRSWVFVDCILLLFDTLYCFRVWAVVLLLSQCWTRVREGAEYSLIVYYYYMILCTVSGYGLSCYYCHSAEPGCGKELSIRWLYIIIIWYFVLFQGMGCRVITVTVLNPGAGRSWVFGWRGGTVVRMSEPEEEKTSASNSSRNAAVSL